MHLERPLIKHWSDLVFIAAILATWLKVFSWGYVNWVALHRDPGVWNAAVDFIRIW